MVEYAIVETTQAHIDELVETMRQADRDEIWALAHLTPRGALGEAKEAWTGLAGGRVVCIFGIRHIHPLTDIGVPWMLSSDELLKHSRAFLKLSRLYVQALKQRYATLVNVVHAENKVAIRGWRWLGFELDLPKPFGEDGELFRRFGWEA